MLPDIVFQDDVLDEADEFAPAGPEEDALWPEVSPGTVAVIAAALLGAGPDHSVREQPGRMGLWKRVGLVELMAGRL